MKISQRADVRNPMTYDFFFRFVRHKFCPPKLKSAFYFFFHSLLAIPLVEACQVIWSCSAFWQGSFIHSLNPAGKEPIPFLPICHIHFESGR